MRRVEIVGGGPAGLYAARLLKTARPDWSVTVHERMRGSKETFGFGVVLTESTMSNLMQADPESAEDIRVASHSGHALRLRRNGESIDLHGARNLAIARNTLLEVLGRHARAAGVVVRSGEQVEASTLDADVVIGADGVRSATREKLASELGADVTVGRGLYLWCGADFALPDSIFSPARTEDGLFVAHAYPYAADRSTFLIETDEATWRAAGMSGTDAATAPGDSDEASLRYLQKAFANELGHHRLLGNRSRWLRFHTVHLQRWSHENTVLIGDAAHTAHYTLGSGTKLALEDAIALTTALLRTDDITAAFAAYEEQRRPAVARFQQLAARSQRWWESFPARIEQPLPTLAVGFMTRAGNIHLDQMTAQAELLRAALEHYGATTLTHLPEDVSSWVLGVPLVRGSHRFDSRVVSAPATLNGAVTTLDWSDPDPWCGAADDMVAQLRAAERGLLRLRGDDDQKAVQGRLDLAERLRLELTATVLVDIPHHGRPDAAAALVSGRCDLVHFTQ